jgi:glucosamine--fructose-6-phosphate aminotransferase (isomerizing)
VANESTVREEIASQPQVWAATLRRLHDSREALGSVLFSQCWDALFFCGCGSTHYLSLAAANLHQQLTGQRTRGVASSELALFPAGVYPDILGQQVLLVALSRSGWTTETLRAVQRHRERNLPVLAVTCYGDSLLAQRSDATLAAEEVREQSIPQTRSFSSMYLAAQFIAGTTAGDKDFLSALEQLPARGEDVLERSSDMAAEAGDIGWARVIFLGSGPYYGLACEGMLKLKEMALDWSEAYHFAEFRHGPISLVDDGTLVVGLLSDTAAGVERAVLADVRELGGRTLAIGEEAAAVEGETYAIPLQSGLPELARGALYLPPLQLVAYQAALAHGADPDQPRHLQQTVVLEDA